MMTVFKKSAMLFVFGAIFLADLFGVNSSLEEIYRSRIDMSKKTFKCLDNSMTIPLSSFNDNYRDCPDGSDEPSSPDGFGLFTCKNNGYIPHTIPRWSVGDGICDCCDGSDELFNPHANCSNTCQQLEQERQTIVERLQSVYEKGLRMKSKMIEKGIAIRANATTRSLKLEEKIKKCDRKLEIINAIKVIEDDDDIVNINWTAPITDEDDIVRVPVSAWDSEFSDENTSLLEPMPKDEKESKLSEIRREKQKQEKKLRKVKLENVQDEFVLIYGRKFSLGEYRMKFLRSFHQGSTSLGTFKEFSGDVVLYDNGAYCWQTRCGRKTRVKLVCMDGNKLISVMEPSTCEYDVVFGTPAVCSADALESLGNKSVSELNKIETEIREL